MIRQTLVNIFFFFPVWIIKTLLFFNKTKIRKYIFDQQSKALLALLPKFNLHELSDNEIALIREKIEKKRKNIRLSLKPTKKVVKKDIIIDQISKLKLREYTPYFVDTEIVMLFFHGGGYVLNSIDVYDDFIAYMSEELRIKIYSLEYSLSPESKFPQALNESLLSIDWLNKKGIDMNKISLCGDSAGAHLAASTSHQLAINNENFLHSQFLIYPMCDPGCNSESHHLFGDGFFLTKKSMEWFWQKFSNKSDDNKNPLFNLLLFNKRHKIQQTILVTAGFDPLCDEGEAYALRLHECGNEVKQLHYPTLFHGFASMSRLQSAKKAVKNFLIEYKKIL
mgnify:FL=1|tara:strand:- start:1920 stop:2930 length:1011 start_codon:yes stop_codon:yes gene_type:complete